MRQRLNKTATWLSLCLRTRKTSLAAQATRQIRQAAIAGLAIAISCVAQAQIAISPLPANPAPGVAAGLPITLSISGALISGDVVVNLPVGFSFVSAAGGRTCTQSAALICSGSTPNFTVTLRSPPETSFADPINTPEASGVVSVSQVGAGTAAASAFYTVRSDTVIVPPTAAPLAAGGSTTLNVGVTNGGPGAPFYRFRNTRVLFTLPPDMVYVGASTAPWNCSGVSNNVTCTLDQPATLSPVSVPIPLAVQRSVGATTSSQISYSVATPNNDPNPANNQGSVVVPFQAPSTVDLRLVGTNPGTQNSGDSFVTSFRVDRLQGFVENVEVRFSQTGPLKQQIQTIAAVNPALVCSVDPDRFGGVCNTSAFSDVTATDILVTGIAPAVALGQFQSMVLRGVVRSNVTVDTDPSNNTADVTISVRGPDAAQLQIKKTASASTLTAGQEYTYSLNVLNSGTVAADALVLEDQLDASLSFVGFEQTSASFNCVQISGLVRCTKNQLTVGDQVATLVRVRAPMTPGSIANIATTFADNTLTSQSASATVVVGAGVDLVLDKSDSADPVNVGAEFDYLLSVSNRGTSAANGINLSDDLPGSTAFVSASGGGFVCAGTQNVRCTLASLAPGASAVVRVRVRALSAGQALNSASVSSTDSEISLTNNNDSEVTTFATASTETDLVLSAPTAQSAAVGSDTAVLYTVRNAGPANANCGTLNLTLNAGIAPSFTLKSVAGTGATCSVSGSTASCQLPPISASGLAQISATFSAIGAASANVSAILNCATDTNLGNNTATTTLTGQLSAGANLKLFAGSDNPVLLSSEFNYNAGVNNFGPELARGVVVKLTLPDGVEFVSFSGTNFSCSAQGQIVTCPYAGELIVLPNLGQASLVVRARARAEIGQITTLIEVSSSSRDPNLSDNSVSVMTQINPKDAGQVAGVITPQLTDQFARDAAPVVADICARPAPELVAQCEAIIDAALDGDIGALQNGLRAVFPEEVLSERLALVQQSLSQGSNIDSRLSELQRGGGSGLSLSGLNLAFGKTIVPLGLIQPFLDGDAAEVGGSGDLISPWGFFVNGTYSRGDQTLDRTLRNVSSDFTNIGLSAGVDYRLSVRSVLGVALGYSKFSTDLGDSGTTRSKAITLTGYGSHYFSDNFYADARLTVGNASFDSARRIRFSYQNFSVDKTAFGSNDARQYALATGIGYNLQKGAWSITPNANVRYFRSNVDGYTETGAGANSVIFDDQQVSSLQYNLGVQISRPISMGHGVLVPQFDLSFGHESQDANFALNARLIGATAAQTFVVRAQDADKSFGNVGLGFVYVTSNGRSGYLTYRRLFANDTVKQDSINLGARFEF
jgi:uncharacterized repeat protein (TIGR01451 family)